MFDYLKWFFNFRCKHPVVWCTHGDEIIAFGWKRGVCRDCPKKFEHLPEICSWTGKQHSTLNY